MNDDLIKRLRTERPWCIDDNGQAFNYVTPALADEAAAEIERLRAEKSPTWAACCNCAPAALDEEGRCPTCGTVYDFHAWIEKRDEIWRLEAKIERLKTRLHAQTMATQEHAVEFERSVRAACEHMEVPLPGVPQMAPVEQRVAQMLSQMDGENERLRNLLERVPHEPMTGVDVPRCYETCLRCKIDRVLKGAVQ